jgi:hypothetical protein
MSGVIRSPSGAVLGALPQGFTCLDLLRVLQIVRLGTFNREKSPIYSVLLERPDAIVGVAHDFGCARAAPFVNFLEEFEGKDSEVAVSTRRWLESVCFVFIRGDSNRDGTLDLSDAVNTLGFLFLGDSTLECEDAGDSNDDGAVDIADALHTLGYLFACDSPPPSPFPEPATDPTPDAFACGEGEAS